MAEGASKAGLSSDPAKPERLDASNGGGGQRRRRMTTAQLIVVGSGLLFLSWGY
jgi:hypothetical protein